MVKAFDSKSNGLCPHRFESCPRRENFFKFCFYLLDCKIHVLKTACAEMQSYHINIISFSE